MEIDVSKCHFYYKCDYFNCSGYKGVCTSHPDCYYKQLQRLKVENEELKEKIKTYAKVNEEDTKESIKYKQCLYEIEEIARTLGNQNDVKHRLDDSGIQDLFKIDDDLLTSEEIMRKHILHIIKQAKEGGE